MSFSVNFVLNFFKPYKNGFLFSKNRPKKLSVSSFGFLSALTHKKSNYCKVIASNKIKLFSIFMKKRGSHEKPYEFDSAARIIISIKRGVSTKELERKILDRFITATGYDKKYAIALLRHPKQEEVKKGTQAAVLDM